jgi:hypothetical protein
MRWPKYGGFSFELSTIQGMINEVKPFGDGFALLFSSGDFITAHSEVGGNSGSALSVLQFDGNRHDWLERVAGMMTVLSYWIRKYGIHQALYCAIKTPLGWYRSRWTRNFCSE